MKAEELQIGDLLRVNRDGLCIRKGTAVTVQGIDGSNNFPEKGLYGVADCRPLDESQFQGGIWLDYLDPIPLTPEILEKNGFGKFDFPNIEKQHKWYLPLDTLSYISLWTRELNDNSSNGWMCNIEKQPAVSGCLKSA